MIRHRILRVITVATATLLPAGTAQAYSIWSARVPSGTTQTIGALAWPAAGEALAVTQGGQILSGNPATGLGVASASPAPSGALTDVASAPGGATAVAVGVSGQIYRSADAGHTWQQVTGTTEYEAANGNDCRSGSRSGGSAKSALTDALYSVAFADANTVYITGQDDDVLKSTNGGQSFTEVNKYVDSSSGLPIITCRVNDSAGGTLTDSTWTSATHGFFMTDNVGQVWETSDGLATTVAEAKNASTASGATGSGLPQRLALDPGSNELFATSPGASPDTSSPFVLSADNGTTWSRPVYDEAQHSLQDVDAAGGSAVAVGLGGDIYTSPDGRSFYRQVAAVPDNTTDWSAVAMLPGDPSHALVGGAGGAILTSAAVNQLPDTTPPSGVVSGPASLVPGQNGTFAVAAHDNPGGTGLDPASYGWSAQGISGTRSGPSVTFAWSTPGTYTVTVGFKDLAGNQGFAQKTVTVRGTITALRAPTTSNPTRQSTGGGTVTIPRHVVITGHARYLPVQVSAKQGRRFVITILTVKGHHHRALAATTLTHGGRRIVKVPLSRSVTPGKYLIVVRLFTLAHGHHRGRGIGRQISVLVVIA